MPLIIAEEFNLIVEASEESSASNISTASDGYTGLFLRTCWSIIKSDLCAVVKQFEQLNLALAPPQLFTCLFSSSLVFASFSWFGFACSLSLLYLLPPYR